MSFGKGFWTVFMSLVTGAVAVAFATGSVHSVRDTSIVLGITTVFWGIFLRRIQVGKL